MAQMRQFGGDRWTRWILGAVSRTWGRSLLKSVSFGLRCTFPHWNSDMTLRLIQVIIYYRWTDNSKLKMDQFGVLPETQSVRAPCPRTLHWKPCRFLPAGRGRSWQSLEVWVWKSRFCCFFCSSLSRMQEWKPQVWGNWIRFDNSRMKHAHRRLHVTVRKMDENGW